MKALVLAAGLGTRLRPLTNTTPKPLLPIAGKPLLSYHLDALREAGVKEILINTHYLPDQIDTFVETYRQQYPDIDILTSYEERLLGSAGTLRSNQDHFSGTDDFLIVYGDVLTNLSYPNLLECHRRKGSLMTIACYPEEHPEQKGIIEFDESGRITRFVEKPKPGETSSNFANAGFYVARADLLGELDDFKETPFDFGFHLFPKLLAKKEHLAIYKMTEQALDIGTPESYARAQTFV